MLLVTREVSKFLHRREYWHTILPGTLDQACACFSSERWLQELAQCKDEEQMLTVYHSFIETSWEVNTGDVLQPTGGFPMISFTPEEVQDAFMIRNKTLLIHNSYVWGEPVEAEVADDQPHANEQQNQQSEAQQSETQTATEEQTQEKRNPDGQGDDPEVMIPMMKDLHQGGSTQGQEEEKG